jgi:hypothetical protein
VDAILFWTKQATPLCSVFFNDITTKKASRTTLKLVMKGLGILMQQVLM